MLRAFNSSTPEAGAARFLWVRCQPDLQSAFQDRQDGYTEKPFLQKLNNQTNIRAWGYSELLQKT